MHNRPSLGLFRLSTRLRPSVLCNDELSNKKIIMNTIYRGRFAPSPTGPLHFGSLVAALGSYLEAISQGGEWLVRMEDLDPPREVPGAADAILRCLDAFGFEWQGEVIYQSLRQDAYIATLEQLHSNGLIFHCGCSRKSLQNFNVYPGYCRNNLTDGQHARAIRLRTLTEHPAINFYDRLQGNQQQNIATEVGDFVIRRADGLFAYQLAVVVDDAAQGITDIIRGSDLLTVTPRQIYLQQLLKLPTPRYGHLPIVVNQQGKKLSKQTFAQPLDIKKPTLPLWHALTFLGQQPPQALQNDGLRELWRWARENWHWENIPSQPALAPDFSSNHDQ